MSTTPRPAAATAAMSATRLESTAASTSGPMNSMVTATPMRRWARAL